MVTLGTLDRGTYTQVSQIIGLLQAPGRTWMYQGYSWEGRWGQKNKQVSLEKKIVDFSMATTYNY